MADEHQIESETVEFSAVELRERLPAVVADELRDQLPGLETERPITDWGRSHRVEGIVDRTVYGFLYHYWFRVSVEGIENVPAKGGALLLANHAGAIPTDAAMIAKAVREQHSARRSVHLAVQRNFKNVPGLGMLVAKLGAVASHPANIQRLLFDERELVLAFPEGTRGTRKALKERYRLRPFAEELIEAARTAAVPIVPLAVIGSEEAMPAVARFGPLRRIPYLPIGPALPLPAKFQIRFLEPIAPDQAAHARDVQGLIQENLLEMVAKRRSVWLG